MPRVQALEDHLRVLLFPPAATHQTSVMVDIGKRHCSLWLDTWLNYAVLSFSPHTATALGQQQTQEGGAVLIGWEGFPAGEAQSAQKSSTFLPSPMCCYYSGPGTVATVGKKCCFAQPSRLSLVGKPIQPSRASPSFFKATEWKEDVKRSPGHLV